MGGSPVSAVAAQVAGGVQTAGGATAFHVNAQAAAMTGLGTAAGGAAAGAQASVTVINDIGSASSKARRELESLEKQFKSLQDMNGGRPLSGSKYHDTAFMLQARMDELDAEIAQAHANNPRRVRNPAEAVDRAQIAADGEDKKRSGSAVTMRMKQEEQDRKFWAQREKERVDEEEAARKAGVKSLVERNKFIEQDRKFWEAKDKNQSKRVRPGEEVDAAQSLAEAEAAKRAATVERANARRVRAGEEVDHAQTLAEAENRKRLEAAGNKADRMARRDTTDYLYAGMAASGIGAAGLGFTKGNVDAFSERQTAEFGARGSFGADAPGVVSSARRSAKDIAGVDFTDLLRFETMLKESGVATNRVEKDVIAVSDALAKAGNADQGAMQRVVVNLSQISQQAKLSARDLRELDIARIAGTRRIAAGLGITQEELREKMSKGEISGSAAYNAFISQTQKEAGGFGKRLTDETLAGQMEKTNEQFREMQALMGQSLAPTIGVVNGLLRGTMNVVESVPGLAGALGIGGGALGVAGTVGGAALLGKASLGTFANIMPDKVMDSKLGGMLFGGNRGNTPMNPLFVEDVTGGGGGLGGLGKVGKAGMGAGALEGITGLLASPVVVSLATAVAAGLVVKMALEKAAIDPMEKDATDGPGSRLAEESAKKGKMGHAAQAQDLTNRARIVQTEAEKVKNQFWNWRTGFGPETQKIKDLETEAESLRQGAQIQNRLSLKESVHLANEGRNVARATQLAANRGGPVAAPYSVGPVQHHSNGTQTVLLTIPMHPMTKRVVQGVDKATRA